MYDRDPEGLLVFLVIRRCVNATEAMMEIARMTHRSMCQIRAITPRAIN